MPQAKLKVHPRARSRVSTGRQLFLGEVDQRTALARRFRDVLSDLVTQGGGEHRLSAAEMVLARRASTLVVFCEQCETLLATTGKLPVETYLPAVNVLKRTLEAIGIKRRPVELGVDLTDYLRAKGAEPTRIIEQNSDDHHDRRRFNPAIAEATGALANDVPSPPSQSRHAGKTRVRPKRR